MKLLKKQNLTQIRKKKIIQKKKQTQINTDTQNLEKNWRY